VFQVESRAQPQLLSRLKPVCFEDILLSTTLIRPGPSQGKKVYPYLCRRAGQEAVTYPHEKLKEGLANTWGVLLFQEPVLKMAVKLAGFKPGEAALPSHVLTIDGVEREC
jgi:error-prone DNA polymerase